MNRRAEEPGFAVSTAERERIHTELAALMADGEPSRFTDGVIVQPTEEFFPDLFTPDELGIALLAQRILDHVGLDYSAAVSSGDSPTTEAIWLEGVDGDTIHLGASFERLVSGKPYFEPDAGGTLCLVLAEAYRRSRGLGATLDAQGFRTAATPDQQELQKERQRAGLTAIYLGLGVLTSNHCFKRVVHTGIRTTTVEHRRRPFLSIEAASYAFALQLALRKVGFWQRRKLTRHLEPDARAYFGAAWDLASAAAGDTRFSASSG